MHEQENKTAAQMVDTIRDPRLMLYVISLAPCVYSAVIFTYLNGWSLCAEPCELECPQGFRRDLLGLEVCDCADDPVSTSSQSPTPSEPAPPTCPALIGCTKECLYGYRTDRYGCARCRCNRCPTFSCAKKCRDGFAYSSDGCKLCRCLGML